jgi:sulfotransferase
VKQFVCLSGLPRSGSTLLSAILHQNPEIYAEGNSAVCQLMWDLSQSCETSAREQLAANNRHLTAYELVSAVPNIYYRNTTRPVIVDKCRSWTLPANQDLLRRYVTDTPKTIVLTRPIDEITDSFVKLYERNGKTFDVAALMREDSEPLMRSLRGVEWAMNVNNGEFLFVSYSELVQQTNSVLDRIYAFIGRIRFAHDLTNISVESPEDDSVYGLIGMHEVRSTITPSDIYCDSQKSILLNAKEDAE